jgi:glycosyltransferase involved in cell wall biosynthesis
VKSRRVVVILSTPLTRLDGSLFLSERAHAQTLELLSERFDDVAVVARCRTVAVLAAPEHIALEATGARFGLELVDYGGRHALAKACLFLFSPSRRRALTALVGPADLLYVESPSLESVLVWSIPRARRTPYVIEMRGDTVLNPWYMRARLGPAGPAVSALIRSFFGIFRRGAIGAVFVGEELRARFAPPRALTVAISSVRLPPGCPRPARTNLDVARHFLYVGHLEKVKAIEVILDAFGLVREQLPVGWRLDILGDGPERAALQERARANGIAEQVHFQRRVPWGEQLFRYYETADFLLLSSLTEGNSRTLLEGMSFGLPALSTAVGEAPRLLDADALVPPGDAVAFGAALVRLANSPRRLEALSARNVAEAASYAPAELRRRRASFFDSILSAGRAERHADLLVPSRTT